MHGTSLSREITEIVGQGAKPIHYNYQIEFQSGDQSVFPFALISMTTLRDYVNNVGDMIEVEVAFPAGRFNHQIWPLRNNLKAVITRYPLGDSESKEPREIEHQSYYAMLVENRSEVLEGNSRLSQHENTSDISAIKVARFQLFDEAIHELRLKTIGGMWRNSVPFEVLRYVLTKTSKGLKLDDTNTLIGVDLWEPSNKEPKNQICIDDDTRLIDFPHILQKHWGGIYNTGLGSYIQRRNWYVFPLYDTSRFQKDKYTLTLINVPPNMLPNIERTYRIVPEDSEDPDQVIVLVTGETSHQDPADFNQMNAGNGVRYGSSESVFDDFAVIKDNNAQITRVENNSEYKALPRPDGFDNIRISESRITSNALAESSKLSARLGSEMLCKWENSDPALITPGMGVRYLYAHKNEVYEEYGVVTGTEHHVGMVGQGLMSKAQFCHSAIKIFLKRDTEWTASS